MLELYHWEPNGSYLKPLIAVHEKGLEVRCIYVDVPAFEHFSPDFPLAPSLQTSLQLEGEGPILIHDGVQITESHFMLQYLDDAFPQRPLRPANPVDRWRILAWARFINEVFMPAVSTLGCRRYLRPLLRARGITELPETVWQLPLKLRSEVWAAAVYGSYPESLVQDSCRKIRMAVKRIEQTLRDSQWLVGTSCSLADIDAFAIANCLPSLVPEIVNASDSPRTLEWIERMRARPAVRDALAMSRTGRPEEAFVPGPEHARWG
ncbi:MAG: hypothetical protein DIU71_03540 [Proteobacteria bacterium]|nr:MAG: hypothetical protein DIU71_03540 [Pseudomonadota bacterium]